MRPRALDPPIHPGGGWPRDCELIASQIKVVYDRQAAEYITGTAQRAIQVTMEDCDTQNWRVKSHRHQVARNHDRERRVRADGLADASAKEKAQRSAREESKS